MRQNDDLTARLVRGALAEAERTQTELAELLGISQVAVSRRLRGAVPWTTGELRAVATWLDIPVTSLIERAAVGA